MYPDKPLTNKLIYIPTPGFSKAQLEHLEILFFKLGFKWNKEGKAESWLHEIEEAKNGDVAGLCNFYCPAWDDGVDGDPDRVTRKILKSNQVKKILFRDTEPDAIFPYDDKILKHVDITSVKELIEEIKRVKQQTPQ